jgi:hypothetical protein
VKFKTFAQLNSEKDKEISKTGPSKRGKCLVMPVARDFAAIDRVIEQKRL